MMIIYPRVTSQDTRYAYGVGRIRALEVKLLSSSRVLRLLESPEAEELLRVLGDTDYGRLAPDTPRDYENMILKARRELYALLSKLLFEHEFLIYLRLKYDYYNAKLLVKGAVGNKEVSTLLSEFGNIKRDELKRIFADERYDKLPYGLNYGVPEAISIYYTRKEPRFIDIVLDKCYYGYLLGEVSNVFLNALIKIEVDLINLKSFLRVRRLNEEVKLFKSAFISGGFLELARFLSCFDEPIEGVARYFEYTPYARIISDGVEYLRSRGSFLRLEKLCDDHFIRFLRSAKHLAFGVEPLLAYFYAKENEFKLLRQLFVGKLNGIPDELIKERLPEVY